MADLQEISGELTVPLRKSDEFGGMEYGRDPDETISFNSGTDELTVYLQPEGTGRPITFFMKAEVESGLGSAEFNGVGQYLVVDDSDDFFMGSGPFTIEFFIYFTALPSVPGSGMSIMGQQDETQEFSVRLSLISGDYIFSFNIAPESGQSLELLLDAPDLAINTWFHIRIVRDSDTFYFFLDGVEGGYVEEGPI